MSTESLVPSPELQDQIDHPSDIWDEYVGKIQEAIEKESGWEKYTEYITRMLRERRSPDEVLATLQKRYSPHGPQQRKINQFFSQAFPSKHYRVDGSAFDCNFISLRSEQKRDHHFSYRESDVEIDLTRNVTLEFCPQVENVDDLEAQADEFFQFLPEIFEKAREIAEKFGEKIILQCPKNPHGLLRFSQSLVICCASSQAQMAIDTAISEITQSCNFDLRKPDNPPLGSVRPHGREIWSKTKGELPATILGLRIEQGLSSGALSPEDISEDWIRSELTQLTPQSETEIVALLEEAYQSGIFDTTDEEELELIWENQQPQSLAESLQRSRDPESIMTESQLRNFKELEMTRQARAEWEATAGEREKEALKKEGLARAIEIRSQLFESMGNLKGISAENQALLNQIEPTEIEREYGVGLRPYEEVFASTFLDIDPTECLDLPRNWQSWDSSKLKAHVTQQCDQATRNVTQCTQALSLLSGAGDFPNQKKVREAVHHASSRYGSVWTSYILSQLGFTEAMKNTWLKEIQDFPDDMTKQWCEVFGVRLSPVSIDMIWNSFCNSGLQSIGLRNYTSPGDAIRRVGGELVIAWQFAPRESQREIEQAMEHIGLVRIGKPNEEVIFNSGLHKSKSAIFSGQRGHVKESGWMVHDGKGDFLFEKAIVVSPEEEMESIRKAVLSFANSVADEGKVGTVPLDTWQRRERALQTAELSETDEDFSQLKSTEISPEPKMGALRAIVSKVRKWFGRRKTKE